MQMDGKVFGILTTVLVMIIVLCVKGTAISREDSGRAGRNYAYAALEQEYLERAHQLLDEEGLHNCGVNLRWTDDGDGSRKYTMLLHHRRLERMSGEEQAALIGRLSEAEFENTACSFLYVME